MGDFATAVADLLDPPEWEPEGRSPLLPHQRPPRRDDWRFWLLEAGRGAGKTEACARYFVKYMREHPGCRARIIAPTQGDAIQSCVNGPSGIAALDPDARFVPSAPGGATVFWPNGSQALVLGAWTQADIDRLRAAGNRELDWFEELAAFRWPQEAWDQASFGRRIGRPHAIGSTTPKITAGYMKVREQADQLVTGVSMQDNPHNPAGWVEMMVERYEGTRLGRQELRGELIKDVEGALWTRKLLDQCRAQEMDVPELVRIVVAIDPAATSTAAADDTGIVVAGKGVDGHGYVLDDLTCHLPPDGWATRALRGYDRFEADVIIGEVNNGGEMVEAVIRAACEASGRPMPSYKAVTASRGKQTRAEPIAALFGAPPKRDPLVHIVGSLVELEDQLATWVPGADKSPDRLDAMVWAITELALQPTTSWRPQ